MATQSQRQRILDAIAESCAEKTYAATTIADIVGRAGVSRATFYKHFANKQSCFDAAVDHVIEKIQAIGSAVRSDAATGPENVRKAIEATVVLMAGAPAYTRLVVIEAIAVDPGLVDRFRDLLIRALRIARRNADDLPPPSAAIRTAYGQAQVLIAQQILTGSDIPELLPDLVYIALLPFAGPDEAMKQAQLAR